jgi:hypothetical protein
MTTRPAPMWDDDPTPCTQCNEPHVTRTGAPSCRSHKRDGSPCGQPRMAEQRVCRLHGGKSPRALAAAERRSQERAAREAVATYGLPVDVSPTEALLEEVRWTAGHVRWLRDRVQELEERALVWGTVRTESQADGDRFTFGGPECDDEDMTGLVDVGAAPASKVIQAAGPSIWLDLYDRERKHLVAVCAAALKAGVEERRVRLAEQQGAVVAQVIRAILDDLHLSAEQAARVGTVVPRHLRLLAGGQSA